MFRHLTRPAVCGGFFVLAFSGVALLSQTHVVQRLAPIAGNANAAIQILAELPVLEADRDALIAQFGKGRPQVAVLDEKIKSLRRQMAKLVNRANAKAKPNAPVIVPKDLTELRDQVPKMTAQELRSLRT